MPVVRLRIRDRLLVFKLVYGLRPVGGLQGFLLPSDPLRAGFL